MPRSNSYVSHCTLSVFLLLACGTHALFRPDTRAQLKGAIDSCLDETPDGSCPTFATVERSEYDDNIKLYGEPLLVAGTMDQWDVSKITDMSNLFYLGTSKINTFNFDIHTWDTSKVTKMDGMFKSCLDFNQNISEFDLSNSPNVTLYILRECIQTKILFALRAKV